MEINAGAAVVLGLQLPLFTVFETEPQLNVFFLPAFVVPERIRELYLDNCEIYYYHGKSKYRVRARVFADEFSVFRTECIHRVSLIFFSDYP